MKRSRSTPDQDSMAGLYLYAIVPRDTPDPEVTGVCRESLRVVRTRQLGFIAGALDAEPVLSPATLRRQGRVLQRLHRTVPALLPARFGSFVATRTELVRLSEPHECALGDALELVTGRVQMTVRILGRERRRADSGRRTHDARGSAGPGTRYLARLAGSAGGPPIPVRLRPVLEAIAPLLAAEHAERSGPLTSLYHLIDRRAVRRYRRILSEGLRGRAAVPVWVSGPWPPFAFVPEDLS